MEREYASDDELSRKVGAGDESAFAELFGRYFGPLYDFAIRVTRNRDAAAASVQMSLLRACQGLQSGQVQVPIRLQLFALVHYDLTERLRSGRPAVIEGEEAFVIGDPERLAQASLAAELPDLARVAWSAVRDLRTDDYELLDLNVRQRFDVTETASVVRARPEGLQSRLARAREQTEQAFTGLLLLSRGRQQCLDLDFLIGDDHWSPGLQRRIQRHLQSCQTCQTTRRQYPTFTEAFATLTLVPPPAGWSEIILTRLLEAMRSGITSIEPPAQPAGAVLAAGAAGGGIGEWFRRTFGEGGARGPLLAGLAGVLLVVIIALLALCSAGAFDGDGVDATATASITGTSTPTNTPTLTFTPTETATFTPAPPTFTPVPLPTFTPPPPPTATPPPPPPPTATPP